MDNVADKDIRDAFFDTLCDIAYKDKNVVIITNDADVFSLRKFKEDRPKQFINVGVAEQNMINVAAGLASCGKKVYVYGIASFIIFRCYEQLKFHVSGMNLPIVLVGLGTGVSFCFDGATHHAMQDISVVRALPGFVILSPCDSTSAQASANISYLSSCPSYVRIDKNKRPNFYDPNDKFEQGYKIIRGLQEINFITTGTMTEKCFLAAQELESSGIETGLVDVLRLKPINRQPIKEVLNCSKKVIVVEEHSPIGGLSDIVSNIIAHDNHNVKLLSITLTDEQYWKSGSRDFFYDEYGLNTTNIIREVERS